MHSNEFVENGNHVLLGLRGARVSEVTLLEGKFKRAKRPMCLALLKPMISLGLVSDRRCSSVFAHQVKIALKNIYYLPRQVLSQRLKFGLEYLPPHVGIAVNEMNNNVRCRLVSNGRSERDHHGIALNHKITCD